VTTPLPFPHSPITHPAPLSVGQEIRLDPRAVEQVRFREVNVKEAFTLRDSGGRFFRATLRAAGPRGGEALVYEALTHSPESPLALALFCGVLGRQRMLQVVQKATELGVGRVQPVLSERSVPREGLDHEKAHAWPGQALRACKQCRRASVPLVLPAVTLAEAMEDPAWREAEARFYLDDRASASAAPEPGPQSVCLAIGPEGGWTDAERRLLKEAGAAPLVLGGRVLRAETAVLVGLALLQHRMGDLGFR
jgi:16S rRNA (uracil1498-N3)-methyltransferase